MTSGPSPFHPVEGGVRIALRVTPRASRNAVTGVMVDAGGHAALRVAVTAAAEQGRANQAVIALLSKLWRLPKTRFELIVGATDRRKLVNVEGDPAILLPMLQEWQKGIEA